MTPDLGAIAPDFTLPDSDGRPRRLADLVAERPTILVFYRGHWCPFCLRQLEEYRDRHDTIRQLGAAVVAVSVDAPERSAALREALGLPFVLLSDPAREVIERFDLLNRHEKGGIAYPAVFVLDRDRVVRYRSLDRLASRVSSRAVVDFLRSGVAPVAPRRSIVLPSLRAAWQSLVNVLSYGVLSPRRPPCPPCPC